MRKFCSFIMTALLVVMLIPGQTLAAEVTNAEVSLLQTGEPLCARGEIKCSEINKMLTESAIERGIPPEVAKAVAMEESTWQQWTDAEQKIPNISSDGGIGIMQVTDKVTMRKD